MSTVESGASTSHEQPKAITAHSESSPIGMSEWLDISSDTLAIQYPEYTKDIEHLRDEEHASDQEILREVQALLYRDGKEDALESLIHLYRHDKRFEQERIRPFPKDDKQTKGTGPGKRNSVDIEHSPGKQSEEIKVASQRPGILKEIRSDKTVPDTERDSIAGRRQRVAAAVGNLIGRRSKGLQESLRVRGNKLSDNFAGTIRHARDNLAPKIDRVKSGAASHFSIMMENLRGEDSFTVPVPDIDIDALRERLDREDSVPLSVSGIDMRRFAPAVAAVLAVTFTTSGWEATDTDIKPNITEVDTGDVSDVVLAAMHGQPVVEKTSDTEVQAVETAEEVEVQNAETHSGTESLPSPEITISWIPDTVKHYENEIVAAAERYRVSPDLIAILATLESGGNPSASSNIEQPAEGFIQIWPPTRDSIKKELNIEGPVDMLDINQNLNFGTHLIRRLSDTLLHTEQVPLDTNAVRVIAAGYNGGPGRAKTLMRAGFDYGQANLIRQTELYSQLAGEMWDQRGDQTSEAYERWRRPVGEGGHNGYVLLDEARTHLNSSATSNTEAQTAQSDTQPQSVPEPAPAPSPDISPEPETSTAGIRPETATATAISEEEDQDNTETTDVTYSEWAVSSVGRLAAAATSVEEAGMNEEVVEPLESQAGVGAAAPEAADEETGIDSSSRTEEEVSEVMSGHISVPEEETETEAEPALEPIPAPEEPATETAVEVDDLPPPTYAWPLDSSQPGRISSSYGNRVHPVHGGERLHSGMDVAAPAGTPILASRPGKVVSANWAGGYGQRVVLEHYDHTGNVSHYTSYSHMSAMGATPGQYVEQGQLIGRVGKTGTATGNHLHFEVRDHLGRPGNPAETDLLRSRPANVQ